MRFKRPVAASLAAVMLLLQTANPFMSAFAADDETDSPSDFDVYLTFANSSNPRSNSIVTGGSVTINVRKSANGVYQEKQDKSNGLYITANDYRVVNSDGINITGDAVKTLNILDTFSLPDGAFDSGKVNLGISGAYDAIVKKGYVQENGYETYWDLDEKGQPIKKDDAGNPIAPKKRYMSRIDSDFTSTEITVFETSTVSLICTKTETATNGPEFVFLKDYTGDIPSNKIPMKGLQNNSFENYDGISTNVRGSSDKPLTITLRDSSGKSQDFAITFTPQSFYTYDPFGNNLKADPNDSNSANQGNKFIQEGSVYSFTVPGARSNDIILSVYSPKKAADDIKQDIEMQKGFKEQANDPDPEFIRLAEGDTLNFITRDFEVEFSENRYNTDFYLHWYWVPNNDADDPKREIVKFIDKPSGWQTVTINPKYDDVKGKLYAEIRCRKLADTPAGQPSPAGDTDILGIAVIDDITIKGTGTPASIKSEWYKDKGNFEKENQGYPAEYTKGDPIKVEKRTMKLNAYEGNIPGVAVPEDPFQYAIELDMGLKGGSSLYAIAECVGGDPSLVTMQTRYYEGSAPILNDYSFGDKITNTKSDRKEEQSKVSLIFTPVKTGVRSPQTLDIKITFYVTDGRGNPIAAVTQPSPFTLSIRDDSPSSNARLESLKIIGRQEKSPPLSVFWPDLEKENVGYTFSPDQKDYSISLPFKYQSVKITPTREDKYANKLILVKASVRGSQLEGWTPTDEDKNKADKNPYTGSSTLEKVDGNWIKRAEGDSYDGYYRVVNSGTATDEIPLVENEVVQITFVVIAEDLTEGMYNVGIMRKPVGTDASLKSLKLTDDSGNVLFEGIVENQFEYPDIEIPFKVQWIKVEYEMNDTMVTKEPDFKSPLVENQKQPRSEKVWIDVLTEVKKYDDEIAQYNKEHPDEIPRPDGGKRRFNLDIKTYAEDYDKNKKEDEYTTLNYYLKFHRSDPSEVNTLSTLTIIDATNDTESNVTYTPTFHKNMGSSDFYEVHIPYSVKRLKIAATADDSGASVYLREPFLADLDKAVIDGRDNYGAIKISTVNGSLGWMRLGNSASRPFVPKPYDPEDQENTFFTVDVEVWPESLDAPDHKNTDQNGYRRPGPEDEEAEEGKLTANYKQYIEGVMKYPIHIYRDPASTESSLLSIEIKDQDGNVIPIPNFNPDKLDYTEEDAIWLPYEAVKVQVTPTATDPNVKEIRVNEKKVASGATSSLIRIKHPSDDKILDMVPPAPTNTITVVVYPEIFQDATTDEEKKDLEKYIRKYTFEIYREDPSDDNLLIKLEAGNTDDFKPVFAPMRSDYSAKVAEGAEGITLTPTANHKGAKITIDGKPVKSGETSELIHIVTVNQTVEVVVESQSGKKRTYRVRYQNPNLIEKTSNADLMNLEVEPGYMRPEQFDPSVTEYQVAVDEDTYSVRLIPTLADSLATMQVFRGSQEIGDEEGNYAAAIADGENVFTIEVTSPDETKKKTYTVTVYRGDEENMGKLTPLHAEDIDYENSPDVIIVDVTKYPRIARDVFEELKNYPDKKIIFQGNDYSLQFDASDIENIIPQTEYFSFGMSFRSPLEVEISDEIYSHPGNDDANLVFVYFDYHGALPGPAVLTLSMGSKYKNSTYYWNYYNEERERVDYYGTVNTNSKGTFSLIVDHLSTYIISDQRLNGANDASTGETIGPLSPYNDNDLGAEAVEKKLIPNTGAVKIIGGEWKKGETE